MKTLKHDIAIIGGSMGGTAAAIASAGHDVIFVAEHDWIGGQMTSQGVSALDEHKYIEQFGGTDSYNEMCRRIRQYYVDNRSAPETMPDGTPLNPGNAWVSRLCFEPKVGLQVLQEMMPKSVSMLIGYDAVSAEVDDDIVQAVIVENNEGEQIRIEAKIFLDATDTGEVLPLTDTAYITGAESYEYTLEPQAPPEERPTEVQSFTYCFAIEYHPGEDHTIEKSDNYETMRDEQPYSFVLYDKEGNSRPFRVFEHYEPQGLKPFWTYRRLNDGDILDGIDLALINWHGNDYYGGNILDVPREEKEQYLNEAKQLAIGFLYWLQTEAPRDDGGFGYPGFKWRKDVFGTEDGLSRDPYIREARRIKGLTRIVETDISAHNQVHARSANFYDSVGVGLYALDLHPCVGNKTVSMYAPTKPFQIPLRALIPETTKNLIAACKNIGTTHLTNGAYRLHPIEWNIGESALHLAQYCIENDTSIHGVANNMHDCVRLQYQMVKHGIPIVWAIDVPQSHPLFVPTQMLLVLDVLTKEGDRIDQLEIEPDKPLGNDVNIDQINDAFIQLVGEKWQAVNADHTWAQVCEQVAPILEEQFG